MEKRVTIYDIAKKLNISTGTVNRALNDKAEVSSKTKQLVVETAQMMGFKVNKAAKSLSRNTVKMGFIINYDIPAFHDEIINGVKAANKELSDFNISLECYIAQMPTPSRRLEILNKMNEMADKGINGILVLPSADMRGYHELIQELFEKNVSVATVCSDILGSSRVFSIRQDAFLSGKIAAELLWWFTESKNVAIFTGYKEVGVHAEVIEGFFDESNRKKLNIIGIFENHDDPLLAYNTTQVVLRENPQIEGIYINTANSSAVCKKIKEMGLAGKIKVVASDIFPELKSFMMDDTIHASIFQDSFNQGRLALKFLYQHIAEATPVEKNILIKPQIILKSNVDSFS